MNGKSGSRKPGAIFMSIFLVLWGKLDIIDFRKQEGDTYAKPMDEGNEVHNGCICSNRPLSCPDVPFG